MKTCTKKEDGNVFIGVGHKNLEDPMLSYRTKDSIVIFLSTLLMLLSKLLPKANLHVNGNLLWCQDPASWIISAQPGPQMSSKKSLCEFYNNVQLFIFIWWKNYRFARWLLISSVQT